MLEGVACRQPPGNAHENKRGRVYIYLESDLENIIRGFCCAESELNQCKCLPSLPYCRSSECLAHRDCFSDLYNCTILIKSSKFITRLCKPPEQP